MVGDRTGISVRPNNAAELLAGPHDQAALLAQLNVDDGKGKA
jgi:hypothetical protein